MIVIDNLGSGGAQRQIVNIANGLLRSNKVTIFLYRPDSNFFKDYLTPGIVIESLPRNIHLGFSWKIVKALRTSMSAADTVISFLPAANIYCFIAARFNRKLKHISCEMSITNEAETKIRRFLANLANYFSSHVICNSITQSEYIEALPGMKKKVSAIWNGYIILPFKKNKIHASLELKLIVVGRVAYPKNGVRLLKALQIFYDRNKFVPNVSWAGRDDISDKDKSMKQQMVDFLKLNPDINEKFEFLGEVSDITNLYANSDALIVASIYEGLPNVICEAMINQCPVIASRVSDNVKILGESEDRGFLCDPLSPLDICKAIERRFSITPDALTDMTIGARKFAEDNFSLSMMLDKYEEVVKKINQ